jgi:signal transduction histidine kinase
MRFRTKTILGVAVIEVALLAVLVGSALSVLRESNEDELTRRVQLGGRLLVAAAKDAVISQDLATLDSLVSEAMESGQIDFVRVLDARGVVLAERGDAALLSRPFHPNTAIASTPDGIYDWSASVLAGGVRHGEVRIGVSTAPLKSLLATAQRWAAGIAGLEMVLVALFSWLLGSYLVRQLETLRKASQRIAAGDFQHRVPVQGDDELAQTAQAFNHMAQKLGDSDELLRAENSQRLDAQQSAEDRSEQLNAIFALSPDGFVSFDATYRVKYASPAFVRLTGLPEQEVLGLDEAAFSERLAKTCIAQARFPGVATLRAMQMSGRNAGSDSGRRHLIELAGASQRVLEVGLRTSEAATVSQILYLRDVTHETEVDRLKSEFLSTAAHELRTPMASVYGFAELLASREFEEAERKEFLGIIINQSEVMMSIINELLDLARIEARRGKDFTIERIDLGALIPGMVSEFSVPDGRNAPTLPHVTRPHWVNGDRRKLTQALSNVISNAYKYSPLGGNVEIDLIESADDDKASSRFGVRVSDHGLGMTPEQLARVCERFYRADTSGKIPGTGLGMSIVKEIIELHGGNLEITSVTNTGTVVTLWIPDSGTIADTTCVTT